MNLTAAHVCDGCEHHPWPHERGYGHFVYQKLHNKNLPTRRVAALTNMKDLPCASGQLIHRRQGACLMG
eukprot:5079966-Amphidinium_carterae.1